MSLPDLQSFVGRQVDVEVTNREVDIPGVCLVNAKEYRAYTLQPVISRSFSSFPTSAFGIQTPGTI